MIPTPVPRRRLRGSPVVVLLLAAAAVAATIVLLTPSSPTWVPRGALGDGVEFVVDSGWRSRACPRMSR